MVRNIEKIFSFVPTILKCFLKCINNRIGKIWAKIDSTTRISFAKSFWKN